ncbi:phosphotransferase [Streptomyces scabiei]|nr:phosphotransferase [Streptomyces scabiei]
MWNSAAVVVAPDVPDVLCELTHEGAGYGAIGTPSRGRGSTGDRLGVGPSGRQRDRHSQLGPCRAAPGPLRRPGSGRALGASGRFRVRSRGSSPSCRRRRSGGRARPSGRGPGPRAGRLRHLALDLLRTCAVRDRSGRPRGRVPAAPRCPAPDRSGRTACHRSGRLGTAAGERPAALPRAARRRPTAPHRHTRRTERTISVDTAREQLLHGEPHPGNLLNTRRGPLFVDLATCCRGPVEFDLAHAPEDVGQLYAGADQSLIRRCRALNWAMFSAWRWRRDDQMPDRRHWRVEGLRRVRAALDRCGTD